MPTLVHLANERNAAMIPKNGIVISKHSIGIYCMPVLPNFYVTHQWLRELKRGGAKTFVGVYFKVSLKEVVFAGKYGLDHHQMKLGESIAEILNMEDPLGYELIIDRKIMPSEILRIKHLPQVLGWRYMPNSHNRRPCSCELCLKGTSITPSLFALGCL